MMGHPENKNTNFVSFFLLIVPIVALSSTEKSPKINPTKVTQVSWHPRAFIYKGFLIAKECDHLINQARDKLVKSQVADHGTGRGVESKVRTSTGTAIFDEVVANIDTRISAWTMLPRQNGEVIQILRYEKGQKYNPHFDFFEGEQVGGPRVATVLMYLSDVIKGGETVFPDSDQVQVKDGSWSDCAMKGFAVKPKKGDALLFFSLYPNATSIDVTSLHGGCPVVEGEKWSATKWIHVGSMIAVINSTEAAM